MNNDANTIGHDIATALAQPKITEGFRASNMLPAKGTVTIGSRFIGMLHRSIPNKIPQGGMNRLKMTGIGFEAIVDRSLRKGDAKHGVHRLDKTVAWKKLDNRKIFNHRLCTMPILDRGFDVLRKGAVGRGTTTVTCACPDVMIGYDEWVPFWSIMDVTNRRHAGLRNSGQ